jgi:hypothetical protein
MLHKHLSIKPVINLKPLISKLLIISIISKLVLPPIRNINRASPSKVVGGEVASNQRPCLVAARRSGRGLHMKPPVEHYRNIHLAR